MTHLCCWCGKRIDICSTYKGIEVGTKLHFVCGDCCQKIDSALNGDTTIAEIITDHTNPALLDYYRNQKMESKSAPQQEQTKTEAQTTDPLYDDLHQIAGDLRFIKNYLIFTIIAGIILGLVVACSNM